MFTPFAFVKSAAGGAFNPELINDLYYWWDFTDSGNMTFSAGTTIATVSNKATRTSGNETLNAVNGSPQFTNSTVGSTFTSSDAISNTNTNGTGGNLDCLFSGVDATVIWIGNLQAIDNQQDGNNLWAAAGTGIDDVRVNFYNVTTDPGGTKCSSDSAVSATFQYLLGWHDYITVGSFYYYRTYNTTPVGVDSFVAYTADYSALAYNSIGLQKNTQTLCTAVPDNNRASNTSTNRGFKVNARSRSGAQLAASQKLQHILIYNGVLTNAQITTIYNSWEGSL